LNSVGDGDLNSPPASTTTLCVVPSTPAYGVATTTTIPLTWTSTQTGNACTSFEISYLVNGAGSAITVANVAQNAAITGLSALTNYNQVKVRALNSASAYSAYSA